MSERLLLKARMSEAKKHLTESELRADSCMRIIRDIIDPFGGHFTTFDMERALVTMRDFHKLWKEARDLKEKIAEMERALDG